MCVAGSVVSSVFVRVCLHRVCRSFACGSNLTSLRGSPCLVGLVAEINTWNACCNLDELLANKLNTGFGLTNYILSVSSLSKAII